MKQITKLVLLILGVLAILIICFFTISPRTTTTLISTSTFKDYDKTDTSEQGYIYGAYEGKEGLYVLLAVVSEKEFKKLDKDLDIQNAKTNFNFNHTLYLLPYQTNELGISSGDVIEIYSSRSKVKNDSSAVRATRFDLVEEIIEEKK